jgi:hypothetical protein
MMTNIPELSNDVYEKIKALRQSSTQSEQSHKSVHKVFNVGEYLRSYGIPFTVKQKDGVTYYELVECIFAVDHTSDDHPGDAAISQDAEGRLGYHCFHDHCSDKTWRDVRRAISGDSPISKGHVQTVTDDEDEDTFYAGSERPFGPPGEYLALCVGAKKSDVRINRAKGPISVSKIILTFQLVEEPFKGAELAMFMNTSQGAMLPGSKYYQSWQIANGQKPKRGDRMPRKVFKNKLFRVSITTVRPRFNGGSMMPDEFHYSRVDQILKRESIL